MSKSYLIAAVAAATFVCTSAQAAELPGYELKGFPVTRHQLAIIGAANVREQSPVPKLMLAGMPASPSQVAILGPHRGTTSTAALVKPAMVEMVSK